MTRRDWLLVGAFAGLLALLLTGLGFVDSRRAARQLAQLESAVCGTGIEPAALSRLGELIGNPENGGSGRGGRAVAARVLRSLPPELRAAIYFEREGALWTLSASSRQSADGASSWPQTIGLWESVAWAEGCRAARSHQQLVVARTVRVSADRFAVIVARRSRDLAW